jgi:hypothetical protein
MPLILEKQPQSLPGAPRRPRRPDSPPAMEDMVPSSTKEQKHLQTLWDKSQGRRETGLPYRNLYIGAVSLILAGFVFQGIDSSYSPQGGGLLMLAGGLIGAFYSYKSLRQNRLSAREH